MDRQKKNENKNKLVAEFKREDLDVSAFSDEDIEYYNKILKPKIDGTESYGIRKSKEEKERFITELEEKYKGEIQIKSYGRWKSFWKTNNIVIGDLNKCDFILTAHYDTPPQTKGNETIKDFLERYEAPVKGFQIHQVKAGVINKIFYMVLQNSWFSFLIFLLSAFLLWNYFTIEINNFFLSIIVFAGLSTIMVVTFASFIKLVSNWGSCLVCFNDNSLGVVMALQLYKEFEGKGAVILFDNEENGLIGSGLMKDEINKLNKPVINFDTICLGNSLIFNYSKYFKEKTKNASEIIEYLRNKDAYKGNGIKLNYEVAQDHINFSNYLWISYATIVNVHNQTFIKKGPIHTYEDNEFLIERFKDYKKILITVLNKIIEP